MASSLKETQAISEIAELLYRFLPGNPHPFAAADISLPGVANKLGLSKFWIGGSKKPAIIQLLQATLDYRRDQFCNLIVEIVKMGIAYLSNKGEPVTRDEIVKLNQLITKVNFKIPDLWDPTFLDSLPSSEPIKKEEPSSVNQKTIENLKNDLNEGTPIIQPTLFLPEVIASIARKKGEAKLALELAKDLRNLSNLTLVILDENLADFASEIAANHRLRGSDAIYAAVALRYGTKLITLDKEQLEKLPKVIPVDAP